MVDKEIFKSLLSLFNVFLFRKGFFDFFREKQQDGMEAAKKLWNIYPYANIFSPNAPDIYERLIDFYIDLGLAPKAAYDELIEKHEKLQFENTLLRETFIQLQLKVFAESGQKVREAWKSTVEKQVEMNKEMARNFFELFRQGSTSFYGKVTEEPANNVERRREIRHKFSSPVEFVLHDADEKAVKGVILNISDSGLCINSSIPLSKGQKAIIKTSLPIRHQTFTVQWTDAHVTGLSA